MTKFSGSHTNTCSKETRVRRALVYASDTRFWPHTLTSLYSLVTNNPDLPLDIYLLVEQPDERIDVDARVLQAIHGDLQVIVKRIDHELLENAPINLEDFTLVTYYRLLLGRIMPESVERLVYLDGDTIVRGPIDELFHLDMRGQVLAAVPHQGGPHRHDHWKRLGLPDGSGDFNCGVLVIDLNRWREIDVESKALNYIAAHRHDPIRLQYQDQDTLNAVLVGQWLAIDRRFNFGEWTVSERAWSGVALRRAVPGIDDRLIAHFAGPVKPWHGGSLHPDEHDYWRYRSQTRYWNWRTWTRSRLMVPVRLTRFAAVHAIRSLPFGDRLVEMTQSVRSARRNPGAWSR